MLLEAEQPQVRLPRARGRRVRTCASSGAGPRSRRRTGPAWRSRRRSPRRRSRWSGACRSSRRAASAVLWVGATAELERRWHGSRSSSPAARSRIAPGSSSCPSSARRQRVFRAGRAWRGNVRSPDHNRSRCARTHLRVREPEGRRRQDDDRREPRRVPRGGRRARAVVDLDPQANATSGLGERANGTSSYDLLDGAPLAELAKPTRVPEPLPGPVEAGARRRGGRARAARRRRALPRRDARAGARSATTSSSLDCPPSLGPLTVNALAAADRVLVPVQAEYYALEGLAQLVQSIELIATRLNPRLAVAGVLLTMVDGRTKLSADVADEVRRHFGPLVFRARVPRSVRIAEAPSHGLPVITYDRALGRRGGLLEGGDGACRASLTLSEPSAPRPRPRLRGADRRRRRSRARARAASSRSTRTRASRGGASTTRRPPGSPTRSGRRGHPAGRRAARARRAATS